MYSDLDRQDRPVSNQLHPGVYFAIVGLALWLALAVWAFAWDAYTDYLLAIVSGFVFIAVMLPLALLRMGRKHPASDDGDHGRKNHSVTGQRATFGPDRISSRAPMQQSRPCSRLPHLRLA